MLVSLVVVEVEEVKRLPKMIEELAVEAVAVVLVSRLVWVVQVVFLKQELDNRQVIREVLAVMEQKPLVAVAVAVVIMMTKQEEELVV